MKLKKTECHTLSSKKSKQCAKERRTLPVLQSFPRKRDHLIRSSKKIIKDTENGRLTHSKEKGKKVPRTKSN